MKQLLLLLGFTLLVHAATSQVYVGKHRLDSLDRPFITVDMRTSMYLQAWSLAFDLGKGESETSLLRRAKGQVTIKSVTDLVTVMHENGWVIAHYGVSNVSEQVVHIFIFQRKDKVDTKPAK